MLRKINLTKKSVMKRVGKLGSSKSRKILRCICKIINMDEVKRVGEDMNKKFIDTDGRRPAYDRLMIIGSVLFCMDKKINTFSGIEREIEDNAALLAFVDFIPPKYTVIMTFLREVNEIWLKEIFYRHLVLVNDYEPLNFDKVFIDGTDVIANASINYTINQKQVEAARLLHEWKLLHNGNKAQIDKTVRALKEKLEEYEYDEEICEFIQIALKRPQIYTRNNYERLGRIEEVLNETGSKAVSISFPEGVIMKTKKGRFDVGFNLQMLMLSNHIILAGYLTRTSNDENVMQFILDELKSDLEIFIEQMEKYGENKEDIKKLENLLDNVTFICDSGYFTDENIKACFIENVELVVMSKQVARQENNKKRESWYKKIQDVKNHKSDKVNKYLCIRIKNGYMRVGKMSIIISNLKKKVLLINKFQTSHSLKIQYDFMI